TRHARRRRARSAARLPSGRVIRFARVTSSRRKWGGSRTRGHSTVLFPGRPAMAECLRTDLTSWEIGPYHGALPGPMKMRLKLDGEIVISGEVETGYLHRGLERAMEMHLWQAAVPYADHLDPEGAVFGELALCLAVEEIGSLEVSARAQRIRVLLSELSRISGHMGYIVKAARAVGA